jgi:hypothetical protein
MGLKTPKTATVKELKVTVVIEEDVATVKTVQRNMK